MSGMSPNKTGPLAGPAGGRRRSAGPVPPGGRRTLSCHGGAGRRGARSLPGTSSVESNPHVRAAVARRVSDALVIHAPPAANLTRRVGASRVDEIARLLKVEDEIALRAVDCRQEPLAARKRALADASRRCWARQTFVRRFS